MSKEEKAVYLGVMRRRYAAARRKKARGRVLDEFCEMTGLSRKHAIKALSPERSPPGRRGCPPGGTRKGTAMLVRLWKLSDIMCGKLLKAILQELTAARRQTRQVVVRNLVRGSRGPSSAKATDAKRSPSSARGIRNDLRRTGGTTSTSSAAGVAPGAPGETKTQR